MKPTPLSSLWSDLWTDLGNPALLWQVVALVACFALGWSVSRAVRGMITARDVRQRVVRMGVESFARVLWPLLTLVLIAVAKALLERWYNVNLLRVAMPLAGSFALVRLAFYVLRRVFARSGRVGSFVLLFERGFASLVWIGFALYVTGLWPELMAFLEHTMLPLGRYKVSLSTILQAVVSVGVTIILALWAGATLEERLMRIDTMHSSLRAVMARMGRAVMILIALLVSLSLVGIDLTVLSVFGGALGVGLGLGLQKLASSYVSGFVILLERSLSIGDVVTVDKFSGRVTRINTRYTVLRGGDGVESVVPNEMLVSSSVQNFSAADRYMRLATYVTVDYQTDIDSTLRLLEQAAAGVDRVSKAPEHAPVALLLKFSADGIDLEIGFWIADPENARAKVLSDVNRAIWRAMQAHQIKVPYPQREIRLIKGQDGTGDEQSDIAIHSDSATHRP
jgi:small-conductance mechanosensitive channel